MGQQSHVVVSLLDEAADDLAVGFAAGHAGDREKVRLDLGCVLFQLAVHLPQLEHFVLEGLNVIVGLVVAGMPL